jgi:hypothetical protein
MGDHAPQEHGEEHGLGLLHPEPESTPRSKDGFAPYALAMPLSMKKPAAPGSSGRGGGGIASRFGEGSRHKLSREDEAKLVLEHTAITPAVARTLAALFLLTIFSVPIIQNVIEIRRNLAARQEEAAGGQAPQGRILPQSFDVVSVLPTREEIGPRAPAGSLEADSRPAKAAGIRDTLEDESVVAQWFPAARADGDRQPPRSRATRKPTLAATAG